MEERLGGHYPHPTNEKSPNAVVLAWIIGSRVVFRKREIETTNGFSQLTEHRDLLFLEDYPLQL